ncbi:hypothetical protein [Nostoc parmelioides]|uniref:hypothetical protein n=1 Tax=Nostoc parmelioides TaxID=1521621 RepID=UPI00168A23D8|nr:hypothetical protein [Nostoc parmelioides]
MRLRRICDFNQSGYAESVLTITATPNNFLVLRLRRTSPYCSGYAKVDFLMTATLLLSFN